VANDSDLLHFREPVHPMLLLSGKIPTRIVLAGKDSDRKALEKIPR
jgi:hypothetical protein